MIAKKLLQKEYLNGGKSMQEIANQLRCSVHKVAYYMDKYNFPRRTISEAIYQKHNPNGDPFHVKLITSSSDAQLLGMGLGLYWGEGTKANQHSVRLGNTDPKLILTFITFLERLFGVKRSDLRFGLQIFSDINPQLAQEFWVKKLDVDDSQFYRLHVTISGAIGTYKHKSDYGVLTVYYHNKKLRDMLVGMLPR